MLYPQLFHSYNHNLCAITSSFCLQISARETRETICAWVSALVPLEERETEMKEMPCIEVWMLHDLLVALKVMAAHRVVMRFIVGNYIGKCRHIVLNHVAT